MDRLKMHTPDLAAANFRKLAALLPNAVTETIVRDEQGREILERAIDVDVLRQEISSQVVEGVQERYQFTWPDKRKSIVNANRPLMKTLRLDRGKSVGRDGTLGSIDTENLYIEGENLDVLKLLQETYLGKVKMIYIDPPYNTGSDTFVYNDDYSEDIEEFSEQSGQRDENGNLLFNMRQNNESNGRFHTNWLNMIYPRLRIARDLLTDDGVIFISIDDNEVHNLRKICDEVFGADNFVAQFVWRRRSGANDAKNNVSLDHEYVLCYTKTCNVTLSGIVKEFENYSNPDDDPRGDWAKDNLTCGKTATQRPNLYYPIIDPQTGTKYDCNPDHVWRFEKSKMEFLIQTGKVIFPESGNGRPAYKRHREEVRSDTKPYSSIIETRLNSVATKEVRELLGGQVFDYPKTVDLLKQLIYQISSSSGSIVLDFFSGSATTAHAVMQHNADLLSEGGGAEKSNQIKFIMVQIPEKCDERSEAFKAGYTNICEIGEQRIRRAGKKIQEELTAKRSTEQRSLLDQDREVSSATLDIGFRVLRLDDTNMENVYYYPEEYQHGQTEAFVENVKPDRTPEDLLIQVMLELGVPLSCDIQETEVDGKKIFSVAQDYLIACFDQNVTEETVTTIAKRQPCYAIFRDNGIATDSVLTNFEQIFETYSPKTQRKVL